MYNTKMIKLLDRIKTEHSNRSEKKNIGKINNNGPEHKDTGTEGDKEKE